MALPSFPTSLPAFIRRFPDERAAFQYLIEARWPGGKFDCPKCGGTDAYAHDKRMLLECKTCGYQLSATAGTVMHRSKQPLMSWLLAAWLLVTDKRGLSAMGLQRELGIGRYETAFQMLHKLRAGMVAPDREKLRGRVEVDETFLMGGPQTGKAEATENVAVVGAVEVRGAKLGRVRFRHLSPRNMAGFMEFLSDTVEPGTTVVTDAAVSYKRMIPDAGYRHVVESTRDGLPQDEVLRGFHLAVSLLKRYLSGTYHGAVSPKHVQAYLNEYAFRFNRRDNLYAAFQRVLGIGTSVEGPTYASIYAAPEDVEAWVHPNPKRVEERIPLYARVKKARR